MNLVAYADIEGPSAAHVGTVSVWDISSEGQPLIAVWNDIGVDCICVSAVGRRIGIASYESSTVSVYEIPSQTLIQEIGFDKDGENLIECCCCDIACTRIAVPRLGRTCTVYDANSGHRLLDFPKLASQSVERLLFSADGQYVFASYERKLVQYDASTGAVVNIIDNNGICAMFAHTLHLSPSGTRVFWLHLHQNQSICHLMALNILTGVASCVGEFKTGLSVLGVLDEDVIIVSGVDYYNVDLCKRMPAVVRDDSVWKVAVVNNVPVAFAMNADHIGATNLASGEELFRLEVELHSMSYDIKNMQVSTSSTVVLM
jgi:hypothetical protein